MSKELDKLIEQVLSEKLSLRLNTVGKADADLKSLAAIDGDDKSISKQDLDTGLKDANYRGIALNVLRLMLQGNNDFFPAGKKKAARQFIKDYADIVGLPIESGDLKNSELKWLLNTPLTSTDDYDNIEQAADPKTEITLADFKAVLGKPEHDKHYEVAEFIDKIVELNKQGKFEEPWKTTIKLMFEPLLKIIPRVDPENRRLGFDLPLPQIPVSARYATNVGWTTPALVAKVFENVISGAATGLVARTKALENYIGQAMKNQQDTNDIARNLSTAIVLKYLRDIIQSYEASASGFLFENFLALLLAGTKEGGNLKIEDFTFQENQTMKMGSAKLYRADATSFGGSFKLLYNKALIAKESGKEQSLTYVIAIKGMDLDKLAVYTIGYKVFPVELDPSGKSGSFKFRENDTDIDVKFTLKDDLKLDKAWTEIKSTKDGEEKTKKQTSFKTKMSPINKDEPLSKRENLVYRVTLNLGGIVERPQEFNKTITTYLDGARKGVAQMYKHLNNFNIQITDFLTEKDTVGIESLDAADGAMESFLNLRKVALDVVMSSGNIGMYGNAQKTFKHSLEESSSLDQLIEAVMKGMLNETK